MNAKRMHEQGAAVARVNRVVSVAEGWVPGQEYGADPSEAGEPPDDVPADGLPSTYAPVPEQLSESAPPESAPPPEPGPPEPGPPEPGPPELAAPQPAPGPAAVLRAAFADRLPPGLGSARFSPGAKGMWALVVVALLAALVAGVAWWRSRAVPVAVPPPAVASRGPATASPGPSGTPILVDVAGRVRRPGVVRLPPGSRVQDAIKAAGGLRHGAGAGVLNLARPLVDGEQVLVGTHAPVAAAPPGGGPPGDPTEVVNLNTATLEQLDTLPGLGPVLARRILDYRTAHGPFRSVEQLKEVSGIGDARYADIEPRVRV